jgi:hypothetical protein
VVGIFGAPGAFLSDSGTAFTVFEAIETQQKTLTFSHWARGNAQNECSHQSNMSAIRITSEAWRGNRMRVLPFIALSYTTSAKEGTSSDHGTSSPTRGTSGCGADGVGGGGHRGGHPSFLSRGPAGWPAESATPQTAPARRLPCRHSCETPPSARPGTSCRSNLPFRSVRNTGVGATD